MHLDWNTEKNSRGEFLVIQLLEGDRQGDWILSEIKIPLERLKPDQITEENPND